MKKLLIALLLLGSCTKPEPIEIITDDLKVEYIMILR